MSSESDLQDELLRVAGQSRHSRKAPPAAKRKRSKKVQSESEEEVSLEDESDWEEEYGTQSAKRTKQPAQRRGSGALGNDEHGDARAELNQGDLIADEQDRRRLAAMTELEREMELAERAEKRQQELQRAQLLRQQSVDHQEPAKQGPAPKKKTRGAAAAAPAPAPAAPDGDGGDAAAGRRFGREVREEAAKKSAMEELRAARQRKARGGRARVEEEGEGEEEVWEEEDEEEESGAGEGEERDPYARQAAALGGALSDLEEGEAGGAGGVRFLGAPGARRRRYDDEEGQEEAAFEEVKGIQVRRHRLEEWFSQPFFEGTLPGCVVRVLTGVKRTADGQVLMDPLTGAPQQQYLLAQVVDVDERPPGVHKYAQGLPGWKTPYPFGPAAAKTAKWLRIARGFSERWWPLAQVSNSAITEAEFQRWHAQCEADRRPQLTCAEVAEVRSRLLKAENYTYTAEDVAKLLRAKRAKGDAPHNVAAEKARLERARDAAAEGGDAAGAAAAQAEIDALEARAAAAAAGASRRGGASMVSLNRKNADKNFQNAFKNVGNKVAAAGSGEGGEVGAAMLDPFSRRITRPMIYWNTKQQQADGANEGEGGAQGEEEGAAAADAGAGAQAASTEQAGAAAGELAASSPLASPLEGAVDEDVELSTLDFSVLDLPPRTSALARRLLGAAWQGAGAPAAAVAQQGARVISWQEYSARHGLA